MKYLKSFKEINESYEPWLGQPEKYPKREFDKPTDPVEPFKRGLRDEETKFMLRHFYNHSWSHIDANGYIVLGGGEEGTGKFYITEEDLANFMAEEKEEAESTDK